MIPIFIGGLHRSGTTLLAKTLAASPAITGLTNTKVFEDEGQFLQSVYSTDRQLGDRRLFPKGRVVRWAYNSAGHLTERDCSDARAVATSLYDSWSPYFENKATDYFVEKTPSNIVRTRFLQAAMPEARFVIMTRHPIVQALAVRKWSPRLVKVGFNLHSVVEHWLHAMEIFRDDLPHLTRCYVIPYESLISNPDHTLSEMSKALGIPELSVSTDHIRDSNRPYGLYWKKIAEGSPLRPEELLNSAGNPRKSVVRALESMIAPRVGPREARRIRVRLGHRIARFGYDVDDLGHAGGWS